MTVEVLFSLGAAFASLFVGLLAALFWGRVRQLSRKQEEPEKPYGERLAELTVSLTNA